MNIMSAILTLAAILCALLAIGCLVIWLKGVKSILFPGLGIIVGTPLLILLFLIAAVVIGFLALLLRRSANMNT